MTKMIWSKLFVPLADAPRTILKDDVFNEIVEDVCLHPTASADIVIPDAKAYRSMSRASLMLSHVCFAAKDQLAPYLAKSPFSVGIYCAVENGPIDAPSTAKIIAEREKMGFAEAYRRFRNPKMYLKQLPNLVPAQLGIFMQIQGPMNVYTHSRQGGIQALEQAEADLNAGLVEAALVCSAHAFDDFLVVKRARKFDQRCLVEGAGALLLVRDSQKSESSVTDWQSKIKRDETRFYGIADQIVQLLREVKQ